MEWGTGPSSGPCNFEWPVLGSRCWFNSQDSCETSRLTFVDHHIVKTKDTGLVLVLILAVGVGIKV